MDGRTLAALATTLLLWASGFAGIRAGLEAYTPGQLVALRFLVASATLGLWAARVGLRPPRARDLPAVALLGLVGITVYSLALTQGERTVTAGAASLIVASESILIALMAAAFLGERLTAWGWGGSAAGLLGVALIVVGEEGTIRLDANGLWVLVAALATSVYFVLQKPYLARYGPSAFNAYGIWSGTLFMLPFASGLSDALRAAPAGATLAVVYLGVFPSALGYAAWSQVLARAPASIAGNALYALPPLSILVGVIWLGELPSALSLAGGALTLAGALVVHLKGQAAGAPPPAG
jgi:drug/metabolite transporter (DMT)-like permease